MRKRLLVLMLCEALVFASASPVAAELEISLAYVDMLSPEYLRFEAWVDEAVAGDPGYAFSATDAVYMYRLAGEAPYAALAISMVEAQVAAAEAAIAAHQAPEIAGDSYLEVGPMLRDLALVYEWCFALLAPPQRARWEAYADQAVWNVWNHEEASWGGDPFPWSGWSVDNPGNNYHFSFLEATMDWALAADRTLWLDFLEDVKLPALVAYWQQLPGGGSREGTGYGVALMRLFEIYRVWRDSTGSDLAALSTHLVDTMDYWLHATVPTRDRYAPVGDLARESYPWLFDYHRVLVLQARAMAPGSPQAARASRWLAEIAIDEMTQGFNFRHDLLPVGDTPLSPATRFHHATGAGHLFARHSFDPRSLWLSFVAGPYDESHAHQNQGAFNLFRDDWLAVTENVWTHSGIQQGVEIHNSLRFVDGDSTVPQSEGTTSTMVVSEVDGVLHVVADVAPAYAPSGLVSAWTRTLDLAALGLSVHDLYTVAAGVTARFQVQTPVEPTSAGGNVYVAGDLRIEVLVPAAPTFAVLDWTTVEPGEFLDGWRLEIGGGSGEYLVRLDLLSGVFADGFESDDTSRWSAVGP